MKELEWKILTNKKVKRACFTKMCRLLTERVVYNNYEIAKSIITKLVFCVGQRCSCESRMITSCQKWSGGSRRAKSTERKRSGRCDLKRGVATEHRAGD